jgi:hypothetical protein
MKSAVIALITILLISTLTGCITPKKGNWRKPGVEYCTGYYCNDSERRENWWQN